MNFYTMSYAVVKAKLPDYKEKDYHAKYAELKRALNVSPDPNVVFDDASKTISVTLFGEDVLVHRKDVFDALSAAFPYTLYGDGPKAVMFENAFGTEDLKKRKGEFLEASRDSLRGLGYKDHPPAPAPDANKSDARNLADIIASNPDGVAFGAGHGDAGRNAIMEALIDDPAHGGVDLFFIEELSITDQKLVDQFMATPPKTPLPPELMNRVSPIPGMVQILEKMRDRNATLPPHGKLKAYGINSSEAKSRLGLMSSIDRVAMMNDVAQKVIDQAKKDNPGKKFIAMVGEAHSNTHVGGVPGIAQLFGVPSLKMDGGRLAEDPEDPSLRGMPSKAQFAAMDRKAAAIEKGPNPPGTDAEKLVVHKGMMAEVRFENAKQAFQEPFKALRKKIVDAEQGLDQARTAGIATDALVRDTSAKIARWSLEIDQARADAEQVLADIVAIEPGILKLKDTANGDMTLLHYAAQQGNAAAIKAILEEDTSLVDAKNKAGDTAAHLVLEDRSYYDEGLRKDLREVQATALTELIDGGANLDIPNSKGEVPMHLAALNGNGEAVEALITGGANAGLTDKRGWTPYDVSLASCKPEAEKVFYDHLLASRTFVPKGPNPSIVDILEQVTFCEDPAQKAGIRAMYAKLYADELLRPILELAAVDALQDRDPPDEGGVRMFVADADSTGRLFNKPEWKVGGQGAFDQDANTFLIAGKPSKDSREGILIHEMTHMATRKMYGAATVPYAANDAAEEARYRDAIARDVKLMHLMTGEKGSAEERIKDRISSRMKDYTKNGDGDLLQEFIVGVPQLISEFGGEVVGRYAPSLMGCYVDFTAKCAAKMRSDPTYSTVLARIDNKALDLELKKAPPALPKAPDGWLKGDSKVFSLDNVMGMIEAEARMRQGQPDLPNGVTIAYSASNYKIKDGEQAAFRAKMDKVRDGLAANLDGQALASEVSTDHLRSLVLATVDLAQSKGVHELEGAVAGRAANWARDSKVRLVDRKIAKGTVTAPELAEAILLQAENKARARFGADDPTAVVEVDEGKHKALVKQLSKDLESTLHKLSDADRKKQLPSLVNRLAEALTNDPKTGFSAKKKKIAENPDHVSMDKKALRKAWLAKLKTL